MITSEQKINSFGDLEVGDVILQEELTEISTNEDLNNLETDISNSVLFYITEYRQQKYNGSSIFIADGKKFQWSSNKKRETDWTSQIKEIRD